MRNLLRITCCFCQKPLIASSSLLSRAHIHLPSLPPSLPPSLFFSLPPSLPPLHYLPTLYISVPLFLNNFANNRFNSVSLSVASACSSSSASVIAAAAAASAAAAAAATAPPICCFVLIIRCSPSSFKCRLSSSFFWRCRRRRDRGRYSASSTTRQVSAPSSACRSRRRRA